MDGLDIFISYTREDEKRAQLLVRALEAKGWRVFWDRTIPAGETWLDHIGVRLDAAAVVIVLWSRNSVKSEFVYSEASRARGRRALVPVLIDPVAPPLGLDNVHAADLVEWTADGGKAPLPPSLADVLERRLKAAPQTTTKPPSPTATTDVRDDGRRLFTARTALIAAGGALVVIAAVVAGMYIATPFAPPLQEARQQPVAKPAETKPAGEVKIATLPVPAARDTCAGCPPLVLLPKGIFTMGALDNEESRDGLAARMLDVSRPRTTVALTRDIWLGRYPITRGEYRAFAAARPGEAGTEWLTTLMWHDDDDHPVVRVSWQQAAAFAAWLSSTTGKDYRLPSEAVWEYAARGGVDGKMRPWGDEWDDSGRYAPARGASSVAPVRQFAPNGFGLVGMVGLVWQWTFDCWNPDLSGRPSIASAITKGDCNRHVLRGGSWRNKAKDVRISYRLGGLPAAYNNDEGFRVIRVD
ncbi:MAG: SUMF1/EgtB/PvdO family nonheme iron enzyme [Alphaproteobacteria bacterium]|nr:SUMF1/EgtB/PvdO family nonheme iron enzyme [Alphaproteobacteria bacterium]